MSFFNQLGFNDSNSPLIFILRSLHDHIMVVLVIVIRFVGCIYLSLLLNKYIYLNIYEAQLIETIWTVIPSVLLIFLAFPSLRLLYFIDEVNKPCLTLKAIGHQWYWSYEYRDFLNLNFDSYIIPTDDLLEGEYRLLEVDHRVIIPINIEVRVLVSSADVIHSWTVPSLGVKADAIPGRLNQIGFKSFRSGVFYGQCREICGSNHRFIPIVVEVVNLIDFLSWIKRYGEVK